MPSQLMGQFELIGLSHRQWLTRMTLSSVSKYANQVPLGPKFCTTLHWMERLLRLLELLAFSSGAPHAPLEQCCCCCRLRSSCCCHCCRCCPGRRHCCYPVAHLMWRSLLLHCRHQAMRCQWGCSELHCSSIYQQLTAASTADRHKNVDLSTPATRCSFHHEAAED